MLHLLSYVSVVSQILQVMAGTGKRLADRRGADENDSRVKRSHTHDSRPKPDRVHAHLCEKTVYQRGQSMKDYDSIRNSHHPCLFLEHTHFELGVFGHLFSIAEPHLEKPMNPCLL